MTEESRKYFTVSEVNGIIHDLVKGQPVLQHLEIEGEVSNVKYSGSGHIYFTLKDASSEISCAMWRSRRASGLRFPMKDGDRVVVTGYVDVYEKNGRYSVYADRIVRFGLGELFVRYEQLKKELAQKGYFAEEHKKAIPKYIHTLGVVTAETGAAVRDIIQIAHRRNPFVQIILCPAKVQGEGSAESVAKGIRRLDAMDLDVLIVGRGGGSLEDLWAFNEMEVVDAIYQARTPVISAVGHEVDFTLSDFTADLRAPTPSAGAELAVAEISDIDMALLKDRTDLYMSIRASIDLKKKQAAILRERIAGKSPEKVLDQRRQDLSSMETLLGERMRQFLLRDRNRAARCDVLPSRMQEILFRKKTEARLYSRLPQSMEAVLREKKHRFELLAGRLEGVSPLKRFEAGYGYVADDRGNHISSVSQVQPGDEIRITMKDGRIRSCVEEIMKEEEHE